jgi:cytochrome c biogenesis protein CcdA
VRRYAGLALADPIVLFFSFSAGSIAFINPCGIAMLPAYVSYYLGSSGPEGRVTPRAILKGALLGGAATLGFMAVFGGAGAVLALAGAQLIRYIPWIAVVIGGGVAAIGVALLLGKSFYLRRGLDSSRLLGGGRYGAFLLFGVAYAIASLSCTIPIFLYVTLQAISTGGFASAMSVFIAYSLGMGAVMTVFSTALVAAKGTVMKYVYRVMPYTNRIAGAIMVAAGAYIVYFQVFVGGLVS